MPSLGADMEDGTVVEWHVKPGDRIKRGDIVAVIDTQKGAIDVEIFEDGVIEEIVVPVGGKVPVGALLARIRAAGAKAVQVPAPVPAARAAGIGAVPASAARPSAAPAAGRQVSPAARKRARELGVDPEKIAGTGAGGAVTIRDVEAAAAGGAAAPAKAPAADEMRRAIGAAMARSKREIPHYYLAETVDLGPVTEWLAKENAARPITERLIAGVVFIRAVALALRDVPEFNGFWEIGRFRPGPGIHPGIAISLRDGGLVAPALHDADRKDVWTLMREFQDLVLRARGRRLRSSELADGTITITSLGERGVETVYPVIYPPQVAVIGFGTVAERPWLVNGQVTSRPVVTVTLGADHRASDGHRGGLFLRAIEDYLRDPSRL